MRIPGMSKERILPDSCHCFHLGWGLDLAASALVLIANRSDLFDGFKLNEKLHSAYSHFCIWLASNMKTSGIDYWTYKKLDMSQFSGKN